MNRCLITLPSLTLAQKARSLLQANGIASSVERLSPERAEKGCGWGIVLSCALAQQAVRVLELSNLPYRKLEPLR